MQRVTLANGREATRRDSILQRTAIAGDSNRHNRAASKQRSPIFSLRISSSGAARIPNFYSEHIKSRNLLKYMTPQDITIFYYEHLNTSAQFYSRRNQRCSPNERPKIRVSNFASGCYSESPEIAPASNQLSQNTALQGRIRSAHYRRNLHGYIRGTQSI